MGMTMFKQMTAFVTALRKLLRLGSTEEARELEGEGSGPRFSAWERRQAKLDLRAIEAHRAVLTESQSRHLDIARQLLARKPVSDDMLSEALYEMLYASYSLPIRLGLVGRRRVR